MKRTLIAILLTGAVILPAWAQQAQDEGYAPDHGVARVSLVNGDVTVRRGDSGDLTAAAPNGALLVNDILATGPNAVAEIQFDSANMIRLAAGSEVRMGELEYGRYLVQIATGTTMFRVLRNSSADVEISTPTVSVRPTEPGSYRISVQPDGTTEITVRSGRAEVFSPRGSETLTPGRTMEARGTPADPEYMIVAGIPTDQWDHWNADRDRDLERAISTRYVPQDVYGAEDLDAYGQWRNDPSYGNVWVPAVEADWAPYRVGHWEYIDFYGWTWVSGDPWGWAPYHYGNWYMSSYGWAWYPGAFGGRHYWRPALVSFFGWGGGGGLSIGFGFGNVGWVPLAPYERYRPWYGRGYNNTTIVNNFTVINNYRNARFVNGRNGVTSINAGDFGRGRRINSNNFVRASNNDLARTGSVQGRLPFNASGDGRRMSDRPVNQQSVPRASENRRFAQRGGGINRGSLGDATRGDATRGNGTREATRPATQGPGSQGRPNGSLNNSGAFGSNTGVNSGINNGNGGGWRRLEGNRTGGQQPGTQPNIDRGPRGGTFQAPRAGENPAPQINRDARINQRNDGRNDARNDGNRNDVNRNDNSRNGNGPGWQRLERTAPSGPSPSRQAAPQQQAPQQQFPERQFSSPQRFPQQDRRQVEPQRQAPQQQFPERQFSSPQRFPQQDRRQERVQERGPQPSAPPQPVRISPPMVQRGPSPSAAPAPRFEAPRGSFGTPRPQGGGGEVRGNPGGNGGGGGNRGGGESRGNGGGNRGGGDGGGRRR